MVEFNEERQKTKLAQLRAQEEEEVVQILSKKYGIPYIDLTVSPVNTDALRLIPEAEARAGEVAGFDLVGKTLSVAVRSPNKQEAKNVLATVEKRGYEVHQHMVSQKSLEHAWSRYKDLSYAAESKAGALDISNEQIEELTHTISSLEDVERSVKEVLSMKRAYRTSRIVEIFVASAIAVHASDIHIEPEEDDVRLRFRLDGILTDVTHFDNDTYKLLLSRLKLLSGLKLNIKNEAQDGRFSIDMDEVQIEIRTSIIPGQYGESIVMRVLNPNAFQITMGGLGIDPDLLTIIKEEVGKPNGMVLATGPTGSGKTTALYAFLRHIHSSEVKIITIEDPIEYHLKGIVQTQVNRDEKYTFAGGLRAALRQDPDVILVGEIRDTDTAQVAVHAALTGHLVLSTLHTNNAAGTFPRLVDLGVSPDVLGSSVNLAMAQRLVRQLCDTCKKEIPLEGATRKEIERVLGNIVNKEKANTLQHEKIWEAVGCSECNNTGYRGRVGVFEAIRMDEIVEEIVRQNPSEREIKLAAHPQGILSMPQDGVIKVLKGITSFDELTRVIDLSEDISPSDQEESRGVL